MEELLFEISGIFDQRAEMTEVYIQNQGALSQISVDLISSFCRGWGREETCLCEPRECSMLFHKAGLGLETSRLLRFRTGN